MDYDQLTEQEVDSLVEKAQAHYREKIRPWSTQIRRAGCWSSTRKAATTRLTTEQRLPQNACGSGGLTPFSLA